MQRILKVPITLKQVTLYFENLSISKQFSEEIKLILRSDIFLSEDEIGTLKRNFRHMYWIQKVAINRLGTNKACDVNAVSYCSMRNVLSRCVVGGCFAFPDVQKGLILHATPFLDDERRKQGNVERSGLIS